MKNTRKPFTILIAEDDPDDRLILKDAFEEAGVHHVIHYVEDGQELMDYLHAQRKHSRPVPLSPCINTVVDGLFATCFIRL